MLRTKQIGTISQCARSFLYSGPRCGSGEGASCTCTDDETRAERRHSIRKDLVHEKKANAAFEVAAASRSFRFKNAVGTVHCNPGDPCRTVTAPSVLSPSPLNSAFDPINSALSSIKEDGASQKDFLLPSKSRAKQIVSAGVATVGMIPDITSLHAPTARGSPIVSPSNYMDDKKQYNPKLSKGKFHETAEFGKAQLKSSSMKSFKNVEAPNSRHNAQNDHGTKGQKTLTSVTKQIGSGSSSTSHDSLCYVQNSTQGVPLSARSASGSPIPAAKSGMQYSGKEVETTRVDGLINHAGKLQPSWRSVRPQAGAGSTTRFMNSTRIVDQYCRTLQQIKWGPSAEAALNNLHIKLDAYQANQVLKMLRDPSVALGFFNWLKYQPGFKHDEHTYTTLIGILGQARQFGSISDLVEQMTREGCKPTVVTYNRLIHAYGRANYIREAVRIFDQMQEAGYSPDRVTYCTLIDIHAKAGYLDVALDLYKRMQDVGLSLDTFTYSAMVNCLGKGGHLAAAYKLFCEMIDCGCIPNLVTYNIMIALQAKARNYPNVVKLYRDMQAAGFRPDKITYSIVMEVLGHCGRLDEAEAVFVEMQHDWIPDEPVYGLLVDLWGKVGNVDRALAWYQSMLEGGLRPNVPTCNSLLSAFLRVHRFTDAHIVLQNMLSIGLIPSLQTYTLLLSCCMEAHSQMQLCCKLMEITGHPAHMFLVSLPDAEPGGQNVRDHASNFLDLMHSEDRESKRGLVDAIIDFLHKSGLKEEAGSVWEVAAQRNVYPDSVKQKRSSYWLINLHVMSEGTAVTALSKTLAWFRRRMLLSGVGPSRIDIVTGWGKRSRVTGSSLVRQSVQDLLHVFGFPFFTEYGNSGCFVGCGEPLNRWLLNSYVERMHLL